MQIFTEVAGAPAFSSTPPVIRRLLADLGITCREVRDHPGLNPGCKVQAVLLEDSVGVLMVLAFYFFRGRNWLCFIGQLAAMVYLNCEMLGGFSYAIPVFGAEILFPRQGFALLALIPIWLYRGAQGRSSKWFRLLCYWFYPVHMIVLYLLMML